MKFFQSYYFKVFLASILVIIFINEVTVKCDKDFDIFMGASKLISEGKNCYEVWLKSGSSGLKYFYSPLFALLLMPFRNASQLAYNMFWMAVSFVLIYRIFSLLSYFLPTVKLQATQKVLFYSLCIATSARFILDNLDLGQMTFLLLWGSMEAMKCVFEKKYWRGSALLALIINFKILPVTLVLYLLYKKEFKAVAFTLLFSILYLFLPALFIGTKFNSFLLQQWYVSLTTTSANSIMDDVGRPSLSSLIPALLMEVKDPFNLKQNVANLSLETVKMVLHIVRAVLLAVVVFLLGKPFKSISSSQTLFYDLSVIFIATPLIFPHQGKYSFFYLLPAYGYCIYNLLALKESWLIHKNQYASIIIFLTLSFSLVTLTTDGLIGRKAADIAEYLHLITYGTFFLLLAIFVLKPKENTFLEIH